MKKEGNSENCYEKPQMKKKIIPGLFLGIITLLLMLSVYPLHLWNDTFTDAYDSSQGTDILQLSDTIFVNQKFHAKEIYLKSIEFTLENLTDPSGKGCLTATLSDRNNKILWTKDLPYRSIKTGKPVKLKVRQPCEPEGEYRLELRPSTGTLAGVRMVSHLWQAPEGNDTYTYHGKHKTGGLALCYRYAKYYRKIQILMIWMVCMAVSLTVLYLIYDKEAAKAIVAASRKIGIWRQVWVILALVSAFQMNAYLSSFVTVKKTLRVMLPSLCLWIVTGIFTWQLCRLTDWKKCLQRFKKSLTSEKELLGVLGISAILRLLMFGNIPKWDAGEYYYSLGTACKNYEFTFESFFENFRLCTHSNLGFSFMMGIAEFLSPGNPKGVYAWNLVLTLFSLFCVYTLAQECWLQGSKQSAALVTLAVSVTPLFLGTFSYVNVDYVLVLFFVYVLYFAHKREYILLAFSVVLLSQSKETGVVITIGYFGMKILLDFVSEKGGIIQRAVGCFRKWYVWAAVPAGVMYALQIFKLGGFSSWVQSADTSEETSVIGWSNTGINCFGFQPAYICYKLKQLLILNFSWLLAAVLAAGLVVLLIRTVRCGRKVKWHRMLELAGAMTAFLLFGILYVTYTLSRYHILFATLLVLLALYVLYQALDGWLDRKIFYRITGLICGLLFIQTFWNIDPLSSDTFEEVSIGSGHTMLFTDFGQGYFGDAFVTNYQYNWIDKAYNRMLKEMDYDTRQSLILTRRQLLGTHLNGNPGYYDVQWDPVKKKRVISRRNQSRLKDIQVDAVTRPFSQLPFSYVAYHVPDAIRQQSALVFLPYYEEEEEKYLELYENYCYAAPVQEAQAYGGSISWYPLLKKDRYCYVSLGDLKDALAARDSQRHTQDVSYDSGTTQDFKISDWNEAFYERLCKAGWSQAKIREYNTYRKLGTGIVKQEEGNRKVIRNMDVITMEMEVYSMDGEPLSAEYVGNCFNNRYTDIVVGNGSLLPEVEDALTGARIGTTVQAEVTIPKDYPALFAYAGQKLRFVMKPLKVTGTMEPDSKNQKGLSTIAAETVWGYYRDQAMKQLLLETVNTDFAYDPVRLEHEIKQLDLYLDTYFVSCKITQQEFLQEYLKVSEEEFEILKTELAKASIRAGQVKAIEEYRMYRFYESGKDGLYKGSGFYSDGWMSDTGRLFVMNTKKHRKITVKYYAPDRMDGETIAVWKDNTCIKTWTIRSGIHEVVWELEEDAGVKYDIQISSSFNPQQEGSGEDVRDLSVRVDRIRLD